MEPISSKSSLPNVGVCMDVVLNSHILPNQLDHLSLFRRIKHDTVFVLQIAAFEVSLIESSNASSGAGHEMVLSEVVASSRE